MCRDDYGSEIESLWVKSEDLTSWYSLVHKVGDTNTMEQYRRYPLFMSHPPWILGSRFPPPSHFQFLWSYVEPFPSPVEKVLVI